MENYFEEDVGGGDNFGTPTDCAFACIILENNYESWVSKGRDLHFDLVTEYDKDGDGMQRQLFTEWRTELEYDPEAKARENYTVSPEDKARFLKVKNARMKDFKELHKVIEGGSMTQESWRNGKSDIPSEMKKKRNIDQMSKKYTKGGSGRKRYGGWSDVAHARLEEISTKVKKDRLSGHYRFFEEAVHTWQREEMEMNEESDDAEDGMETHLVDRSAAWDL